MMEFLLFGLIFVLIAIWIGYITVEALDGGGYATVVLAVASWTVLIAGVLYMESKVDSEGPCVQKEIQMHYNAATKTLMPAEVCILRGKWVEDK